MRKHRVIDWHQIALILGGLSVVLAILSYVVWKLPIVGIVSLVLGGLLLSWALGASGRQDNWSIWQRLRWPVVILCAVVWLGFASLGRHHYTGVITKVTRVHEKNGHHYDVVLKSRQQTYHLEDSVNVMVGKSKMLHLHPSAKTVTVTTSGVLPSNFLVTQNILSVK